MTTPAAIGFPGLFAQSFNSGQVERVLSHYTADAVLFDAGGRQHQGHEAIRPLLTAALALWPIMRIEVLWVVQLDDHALLSNAFTIDVGGRTVLRACSIELLRLVGSDWKLAVDHPYAQASRMGSPTTDRDPPAA